MANRSVAITILLFTLPGWLSAGGVISMKLPEAIKCIDTIIVAKLDKCENNMNGYKYSVSHIQSIIGHLDDRPTLLTFHDSFVPNVTVIGPESGLEGKLINGKKYIFLLQYFNHEYKVKRVEKLNRLNTIKVAFKNKKQ